MINLILPAAERHLILAVCFSAREARWATSLQFFNKDETRLQPLFNSPIEMICTTPLTPVTTRIKALDGDQRDGPNQSRLARRPVRRAEQTVRSRVLAPARGHIRVVELLPVHAAT